MDEKEMHKESIEGKINQIKSLYDKKKDPEKEIRHRATLVLPTIAEKVNIFQKSQSKLYYKPS